MASPHITEHLSPAKSASALLNYSSPRVDGQANVKVESGRMEAATQARPAMGTVSRVKRQRRREEGDGRKRGRRAEQDRELICMFSDGQTRHPDRARKGT